MKTTSDALRQAQDQAERRRVLLESGDIRLAPETEVEHKNVHSPVRISKNCDHPRQVETNR